MARRTPVDIKRLRYVLYARKSTEDENRQVRSIPDQIKDCTKLADDLGITVVDTVTETKSAKKPGQRPLFTQMIKDLESKKYDGILCWHPDRLCRNMLEGGQIINMLDESTLQDIRFHSHQFSNDANGKMLLGMLFVFSKQYSDDLSDKVSRGVEGNFEEGKSSGAPKHGYDRSTEDGRYVPNEYFELIREAWKKRLDGESLNNITKFLNDSGYHRKTKSTKTIIKIKPSLSAVAKMFRDPIYYGLLVQADQSTDLNLIYDFKPMITQEEYDLVQEMGYGRTQDKNKKKKIAFFPLRYQVYCAVCDGPKYMGVGRNTNGSGVSVLSYTCKNPECSRKPRSLRARNVFNSIYTMLENFELPEEAYEKYSNEIKSMTESKVIAIKESIRSKQGALAHIKSDIDRRALSIGTLEKESPIYKANETHIISQSLKRSDIEKEIFDLEQKIASPRKLLLKKEEFLNVIKTAHFKMKAGTVVEKDALCQILFLNVRVDNEKVTSVIWREPFASFMKMTDLSSGGGGWT